MKLADPNPHRCSVCFQPPSIHDPQLPHVDFEVAWDGPVITRHGDEISPEQSVPVPIDDLYICADCLRRAAELIGMEDGDETRARVRELEEIIEAKDKEIEAKDKAISNLDYSMGYMIDAQKAVKRPHGKPAIVAPETHTAERDELRKARVASEKRAKANRKKVTA